jgi:hypothetical protein
MTHTQLLETRRAEALALFQANQQARASVDRMIPVFVALVAAAASVGIANEAPEVLVPAPAAFALLLTYQCHVLADLTIIGMARLKLEALVNAELRAPGLVYETHVAGIHKEKRSADRRAPKVARLRYVSTPMTQGILVLALIGMTIGASIVAFDQHAAIAIAYVVGTSTCLAAAARAVYEMFMTPSWAGARLDAPLQVGAEAPA